LSLRNQQQQDPKDSEAYKNFINSINSSATRRDYDLTFSYFMDFCKIKSYVNKLTIGTRIEFIIRDYKVYLRHERRLSPSSVSLYLSSIVHFYEMNDVVINWRKNPSQKWIDI
jgi:hypothetical protein